MTTATMQKLPPEAMELMRLTAQAKLGDPRGYIEAYFKIIADNGQLVPMLFSNEPNQAFYYQELLPYLKGDPERRIEPWSADALCEKDRKARWTSFVAAIMTAKLFTLPGTRIFWMPDSEDSFNVAHQMVDTFWKNMPEYARPLVRGNEWGIERKVLRFPTPDGGEITNWFILRTAANPNVGSGETPTDLIFDEYGKFPETFSMAAQISIRSALPRNALFLRGGTVGPNGPAGPMYEEYKAIKAGEQQTLFLFRRWFDNPANILPERDRKRRPADMRDDMIILGDPRAPLSDVEPIIASQFPKDGIPWQHRIAWRRAKMQEAMVAAAGDLDVAAVLFQREHPEDDAQPWMVAGRSMFNQRLLQAQLAAAKDPANRPVVDEMVYGMRWRMWRAYNPEHVYIMTSDFGSGTKGDDTSFQMLDATDMLWVGEYHGNVTEPYLACAGGKRILTDLGGGVWVVETNRFPGIGNHIKRTLQYPSVYKPPKRKEESDEHYMQRAYGIHVGATHHGEDEPSVEEMTGRFVADFNAGAFRIANPFLLEDMQQWNGEDHTPDRIASARLGRIRGVLRMVQSLSPVTGAARGLGAFGAKNQYPVYSNQITAGRW